MFRLNKLTDYAIVILSQMAAQPDRRHNTSGLAVATGLSETTVAKILKDMTKSDLVGSTRGAMGGYTLARPATAITVRAVIEAIEGPIAIADCVENGEAKCASTCCSVRGHWTKVNDAITAALEAVTLADMMPTTKTNKIYNIATPTHAAMTA